MRYVEYYSEGQRQRLRLATISDGERSTDRQRPAAGQPLGRVRRLVEIWEGGVSS